MIDYLSLEEVLDKEILAHIYADLSHDYYWSDDFSPEFYIALAKAGFITIGIEHQGHLLLLPQIQREYAVLEHHDLHISTHVKKLLKHNNTYRLSISERFHEVVNAIVNAYEDAWMHSKYQNLLHTLHKGHFPDFKIMSTEIIDTQTNALIGGEIGYITHNIYTGLSKFSLKDKEHTNWGTMQRVLLTRHLQKQGVLFSNLGHPQMQYKLDLGAKIYSRADFLKKCGIIG